MCFLTIIGLQCATCCLMLCNARRHCLNEGRKINRMLQSLCLTLTVEDTQTQNFPAMQRANASYWGVIVMSPATFRRNRNPVDQSVEPFSSGSLLSEAQQSSPRTWLLCYQAGRGQSWLLYNPSQPELPLSQRSAPVSLNKINGLLFHWAAQ